MRRRKWLSATNERDTVEVPARKLSMPGCVLRVSGENFMVNDYLADSSLQPYSVHQRGEIGRRSRRFPHSGLSLDVSTANGDFKTEVADAIQFLSTHEAELLRLRNFPGVTDMRLDFGYYRRDVAAQFNYLPPDLIARAGRLAIGIELSLYAEENA